MKRSSTAHQKSGQGHFWGFCTHSPVGLQAAFPAVRSIRSQHTLCVETTAAQCKHCIRLVGLTASLSVKEAFMQAKSHENTAQEHRPVDRPDGARRLSITFCRRQTEPKDSLLDRQRDGAVKAAPPHASVSSPHFSFLPAGRPAGFLLQWPSADPGPPSTPRRCAG